MVKSRLKLDVLAHFMVNPFDISEKPIFYYCFWIGESAKRLWELAAVVMTASHTLFPACSPKCGMEARGKGALFF